MSLLVSSVAADSQGNTSLADAVLLSFMAGIIQLFLGALRLGKMEIYHALEKQRVWRTRKKKKKRGIERRKKLG